MGNCIAFVLGMFVGGIVCLFGVALVHVDERYANSATACEDGYQNDTERRNE